MNNFFTKIRRALTAALGDKRPERFEAAVLRPSNDNHEAKFAALLDLYKHNPAAGRIRIRSLSDEELRVFFRRLESDG